MYLWKFQFGMNEIWAKEGCPYVCKCMIIIKIHKKTKQKNRRLEWGCPVYACSLVIIGIHKNQNHFFLSCKSKTNATASQVYFTITSTLSTLKLLLHQNIKSLRKKTWSTALHFTIERKRIISFVSISHWPTNEFQVYS